MRSGARRLPRPWRKFSPIRRSSLMPAGGFLINFFMTTFFFHFPLIATGQHHLKLTQYYMLLLPMMVISAVTMFGFSQGADKGWARPLAALAYLMFIPSFYCSFEPAWLGQDPSRLIPLFLAGTLFYIGFTGLEPILPSLVSKAPREHPMGRRWAFTTPRSFSEARWEALGRCARQLPAGPHDVDHDGRRRHRVPDDARHQAARSHRSRTTVTQERLRNFLSRRYLKRL